MGRVCAVEGKTEPIVITSGPHCNDKNVVMSGSGSGQ